MTPSGVSMCSSHQSGIASGWKRVHTSSSLAFCASAWPVSWVSG